MKNSLYCRPKLAVIVFGSGGNKQQTQILPAL